MENPPSKFKWKMEVRKAVDKYWTEHISKISKYHSTMKWINISDYNNGNIHPALLSVQTSSKDISRTSIKLRILTGTYYLQSNKAACHLIKVK